MADVVSDLIDALGSDVVFGGDAITQRATSYWDSSPTEALALLKPRNTEQVSRALSICHRRDQAVITHGGLTGCVEGARARKQEVILSLERMNRIEHIDTLGSAATVQAGVVLESFQTAVTQQGLLFPLDLGARGTCTVGGNIATNAGGINVLRYGMMRNLVLGLEVVTADGTVLNSMNQMLKNNAGYDIKQLFIGSEGTLGIITRAVLRLFPLPKSSSTSLVATDSFDKVARLLTHLQRALGGTLSAYEVMWNDYFHAVTADGSHRAPLGREYPFYVVIEAEGADPEADAERFQKQLESSFDSGDIVDAVIPQSEDERRAIWNIREVFESLLPAYLYDVSLPIRHMDTYVNNTRENLKRISPAGRLFTFGHIADGNIHFFIKPGIEEDLRKACDNIVYRPLQKFGGSVSAEHGIGTEKMRWLGTARTPQEIALMAQLKSVLDPTNILNPGRVLPRAG